MEYLTNEIRPLAKKCFDKVSWYCKFIIMSKKEEDLKPHEAIIALIVIGLLLYNFAPKVFNFVMGGSSDAKEYCGQSPRVLNAKTNKAAKLAFKSCVKRYDR